MIPFSEYLCCWDDHVYMFVSNFYSIFSVQPQHQHDLRMGNFRHLFFFTWNIANLIKTVAQRKVWPFRIQRKHQILRLSSNFPLTQMNRICEKEIFHVSVTSSLLNQELRWSDMSVTNSSLLLKSGGDFVSLWNSKHSGQSCLEIGMRDENNYLNKRIKQINKTNKWLLKGSFFLIIHLRRKWFHKKVCFDPLSFLYTSVS